MTVGFGATSGGTVCVEHVKGDQSLHGYLIYNTKLPTNIITQRTEVIIFRANLFCDRS